MRENLLAADGEIDAGFWRNLLLVLAAHLALAGAVWIVAAFFFRAPVSEPIVWLDGGGEMGSAGQAAAPAPLPDLPAPEPPKPPAPPPPEPVAVPEAPSEIPLVSRPAPTPTPAATPVKKKTAAPAQKKSAVKTPAPKARTTPRIASAKLATPRPGVKAATPKLTDSNAAAAESASAKAAERTGSGDAASAGTKGGPGAPGGSDALLLGYFKKIEARFHEEWQQPLTVVRSGRNVEAYVRLRAAPDGTVESLKLVKPTGNIEVDQSIEGALKRVTKVERPPAALLKNGVLDEMVAFILEL